MQDWGQDTDVLRIGMRWERSEREVIVRGGRLWFRDMLGELPIYEDEEEVAGFFCIFLYMFCLNSLLYRLLNVLPLP